MLAYGERVVCFGRFTPLQVAVAPEVPHVRARVESLLSAMLDKPLARCSFLACTIGCPPAPPPLPAASHGAWSRSGTNQFLHSAILADMFRGYIPGSGQTYDEHRLFYGATNSRSGTDMFRLQLTEQPALARAVAELLAATPGAAVSLESELYSELGSWLLGRVAPVLFLGSSRAREAVAAPIYGTMIRSNQRLSAVKAPMRPVGAAFEPITESRMYLDDVPHGLCVLLGMAELLGVRLPTTVALIHECQAQMGKQYIALAPNEEGKYCHGRDWGETAAPQTYGVRSKGQLRDLLLWDRQAELAKAETNRAFAAANAHLLPPARL